MSIRIWQAESLVNTTLNGTQDKAQVAALASGGYVIVWRDQINNGDIKARLFNAAGVAISGEIAVPTSNGPTQTDPSVTSLSNGGFLVSWTSDANVHTRAFNAVGAAIGSELVFGANQRSSVAALGTGAILTFENATGDIVAQRLDANGALVGAQIAVNTTTAGDQDDPVAIQLSNGRIAFAWQSDSFTVRARIFNADGTAFNGADFQLNTTPQNLGTGTVHLTALQNGAFLAIWETDYAGPYPASGVDVRGRLVEADGTPIGAGDFLINTRTGGSQFNTDVVTLTDGGFLVVWFDNATNTIEAQAFDAFGARDGAQATISTYNANSPDVRSVSAALLSDGRVAVTWRAVSAPGDSDAGVFQAIIDPRDGLITGSGADETLYGGAFADQILGYGGTDTIFALGGDDLVYAGLSADTVFGGLGTDQLFGGEGGDLINGGTGDDAIHGETGADTIIGELGDDLIFGGDGSDTVNGSAGQDALYGGAGADVMLGEEGADAFFGGEDGDVVYGGAGADVALGEAGGDTLLGEDGDDLLDGGAGGDVLNGGAGVDNLLGGADGDILIGGAGGDRLEGGAGGDVYWWQAQADGNDLIVGFSSAEDQLQFTGSAFGFAPGATLAPGANFIIGTAPTQAAPTFVYNNGALYFDLDGTGPTYGLVFIALLQGAPTLTAGDFQFV